MQSLSKRAILEELYRRKVSRRAGVVHLDARLRAVLGTRFDKQLELIHSKAKRRAGFCPRRSGKTETNVGLLLEGALSGPKHIVVFVAKTLRRAFDLTWKPVEDACTAFGIPSIGNSSVFKRTFPNGSEIRWTGADDMRALKKKRGDKLWRVVIDEAQDFDFTMLKTLMQDIFGPALEDLGGDIILTGTPGEVCAGPWYAITGDDPDPLKRWEGWEVHRWTPMDNPHVPLIHEKMRSGKMAEEYGGEDSPTYLREWRGQWVRDTGGLFYRYQPERNTHDFAGAHFEAEEWSHVLGWDLGSNDDMAIVCWAFNPRVSPDLFEAFSWKKPGALSSEVAHVINECRERFRVIAMVADTGGGGKAFVEEVRNRFHLNFEPAQKTDKAGYVRLMNDDLQRGLVKVMRGSPYASEIALLPKVKDWDEQLKGKPAPEDPRFPNHCCDAGLYAWRYAYNYVHREEEAGPAEGTPEYYAQQEAAIKAQHLARVAAQQRSDWWENS